MIKRPPKVYDLTQPEIVTLTWAQVEDLALQVAQRVLSEQVNYFAEEFPSRTQTANGETQTALLEMEAARGTKH